MPKKMNAKVGEENGSLVIIEFIKTIQSGSYWLCQCKICRKKVKLSTCKFRNKICSCFRQSKTIIRHKFNIGDKISYITITGKYWIYKFHKPLYSYICDCGKKGYIREHAIKIVRGCGCAGSAYMGMSGQFISHMKRGARNRNLEFSVTKKQIWELFLKQKAKCALTGIKIKLCRDRKLKTASLDRIDSSKGYTIDNVQWVHQAVNYIKQDFPEDEFIYWCGLVYKNRLNNE